MTTKIGSLAVSLSLDASNFNGSMAQVDRNLRVMGSELNAVKALGKDYGNSIDGLRSKKDVLNRSLDASNIKLTETRKKYNELNESGKATEAQLERQAKKVNDAQVQYNRLATELGEVDKELKKQSSSWYQMSESLSSAGPKIKAVGDGMKTLGKDMMMKVTAPIMAVGTAAFKSAVDFESAFAGVRKTVDATEPEFASLAKSIRAMSKEIPVAATEIAAVTEAAGQLGIKNEALLGFTRTMVDLGVSTNMSSDQAATALARLANITQMPQDQFDRLGSVIVDLGNNLATTESEIVEMGLRLAGAGKQVGMTEAQILAFAGSLSSVGIAADAGGSAFSKVMVNMQLAAEKGGKDLKAFAKVAGISASDFQKAFKEDATGAIIQFIKGLATAEERGLSAIGILDGMGISEVRMRDALLRAAGASNVFTGAIELGTKAWEENTALTKEAEQRYKTTASQLKILWNQVTDVGISIGEILIPKVMSLTDKIRPLIDRFANMSSESQNMIIAIAGIAAAMGPVIFLGGSLLSGIGGLVTTVGAASGAIAGAGGLGAALLALTGPVGIGIGALAALTAGGFALYHFLKDVGRPEIDLFGKGVSESTKEAVSGFVELNDKATVELNKLSWGGLKVTQEMADSIVAKFDLMGDQVLAAMKNDHEDQLAELRRFFDSSGILANSHEDEILQNLDELNAEQEKKFKEGQARIAEILNKAAEEKREITFGEKIIINSIQKEMVETGIKHMSDGELEFKTIMGRMRAQSEEITSEIAIQTIADARRTRYESVEEAEKQYDETIKIIIKLRDEAGLITANQARQMIGEAKNQRDGIVNEVDSMYSEVLKIAKEKGGEHLTESEILVGKQLSIWEDWSVQMGVTTAKTSANVVSSLREMTLKGGAEFIGLKNSGILSIGEMVKTFDLTVNKLPEIVRKALVNAVTEVTKSVKEFFGVGEDAGQGLVDGFTSKAVSISTTSYKTGKIMVKSISDAIGRQSPAKEFIKVSEDAVKGLVVGMEKNLGAVIVASKNTGDAMMKAVSAILTDGTKKVNAEIADINKKAHAEAAQIQKRASEDIYAIRANAKAKNRSLTAAELLRIQRLEDDSAKKIKTINAKSASDAEKIAVASNKQRLDALKQFIDEKKQSEELSLIDEVNIWRRSVDLFADGTKEKIAAQKEYRKSIEAVNKEIVSVNKEFSDQMQEINDGLAKNEQQLNDEYNKTYSARVDFIRNSTGLFDEFVSKMDKSGQDLLNNLRSQVVGLEEWRGTLKSLWSKIDDQALMEELEALGPKAAGELKALNSLSEAELVEYVELYNQNFALAREQADVELVGMKTDTEIQINELRLVANKKLGELQNDWTERIKSVTQSTNDEFKTLTGIGKQAGQNLLDGLASMESSLVAKARSIAAAVNAALQSTLGGSGTISVNSSDGTVGSGSSTDNSRSTVNNVTIQTNESNAVSETERMLRRLSYEL